MKNLSNIKRKLIIKVYFHCLTNIIIQVHEVQSLDIYYFLLYNNHVFYMMVL